MRMNSWRDTTLRELVRIEHGFAFKGVHFIDRGELVVLTPGNFHEAGGFRARPEKDRYYQARFPERYLLKQHDLIVAMTEQGEGLLGSAALIPEKGKYLHNQRLGLVHVKPSAEHRFLYYLFNSAYVRQQIRNSSSGSKVRHTSPERMYRVAVRVPDKAGQSKIAAVLAAYDDLIETNRRRIVLLERMAEEIYREWFVRLRFPGHATTKITKGIPAGWVRTHVSDLTSYLKRGVAPAYNDQADGIVINQKCIRDGRIDLENSRRQSREVAAERLVQVGDILVNSTGEGTLGRVAQVLSPIPKCIVDSHVTIVRPAQGVPARFLGLTLMGWEPHFSTMGRGSTNQTELAPGTIGRVELLLPSSIIASKFEELANPLATQARLLAEQNTHLTRTRDLLLPRLISGKLAVDSLDIAFPPSMTADLTPLDA